MIMRVHGRVDMSGGYEMNSSTQVPVYQVCVGACSYILSCHAST
jgi:hypothetical protein